MRLIILAFLMLIFDWYAFQAFELWSANWSEDAQLLLTIVYWMVPVLAVGLLFAAMQTNLVQRSPEWFTVLRAVLMAAYFAKLLIVIVLLTDDIRRMAIEIYGLLSGAEILENPRSVFMAKLGLVLGGIPFLMLSYGVIRNRYRYKVFQQTVAIPDLPAALEGLKIVQISDVHSGSFTQKNAVQKGIDKINSLAADFVFFTGDLVNNVASEMRPFMDIFSQIKAKYGVFSVTGNHDYGDYVRWNSSVEKRANFEALVQTHRALGWDILMNEHRIIPVNGAPVAVIGVENFSGSPRFPKYGNLAKAHAGTQNAALSLLLSHDPSHWQYEITKDYPDIDITFSGHTHGMQFGLEIPGWFKWSPIKYVYKEWAGLYQQGKQFLYVNRGFGFLGYPGRVGILPEITLLQLTAGQGAADS